MLKYPQYLKSGKLFTRAHEKAIWIKSWSDRRKACKKPGIIVTPAGMLKGGNARFYMKKLARNENNGVFLVSYQIPGTPGAILLENGTYNFGKRSERVKAKIRWFDFSSHCGREQLIEILEKNKISKIILVHGEKEKLETFQKELLEKKIGKEVIVPENGDKIRI